MEAKKLISASEATTSEGRRGGVRISPLLLTRQNRSDKYLLYRASDLLTRFGGFSLDEGHRYIESQPTSSAAPSIYTAWLTGMDQPEPKPAQDSVPAFTLTVEQLRQLVREEIQASRTHQQDADRQLSADEAATLLSVSPDWLYRNAKKLPFTRKLGPKMLRFSYQGIIKWLSTRQVIKN